MADNRRTVGETYTASSEAWRRYLALTAMKVLVSLQQNVQACVRCNGALQKNPCHRLHRKISRLNIAVYNVHRHRAMYGAC